VNPTIDTLDNIPDYGNQKKKNEKPQDEKNIIQEPRPKKKDKAKDRPSPEFDSHF
jgi:hypothetical protein